MSGLYNLAYNLNIDVAKGILESINISSEEIGRFRDIEIYPFYRLRSRKLLDEYLVEKYKNNIILLTRIGGENRKSHLTNWDYIHNLKNYLCDFDCSNDDTYALIILKADTELLDKISNTKVVTYEDTYFLCEKNIFHDSIITVKKDYKKFFEIPLEGSVFINEYIGRALINFPEATSELIKDYCKKNNLSEDALSSELRNRSLNTLLSMIS